MISLLTPRFEITGVPLQRDKIANMCLPAASYMVLKYWEKLDRLGFELPNYEDFKNLFPKIRRLGYPPAQLHNYLKNDEKFEALEIEHKKGKFIHELFHILRQKDPIIVVYDVHYYHTQIEAKGFHTSVLVGYTPENMIINDSFHGEKYSLERNRFIKAWELKEMRYILIKPPSPSIRRWMPHEA